MDLLDIESVQARLDHQFLPLEPMLTGMRLVDRANQEAALRDCEEVLDVTFSVSFVKLATRYDFGQFTIGPVAFCNTGNYFAWLSDINQDASNGLASCAWWGQGNRPNGIVMIANSDPYAILLDTRSGKVLAFRHGDSVPGGAIIVANGFDDFVRGLATIMLERSPNGNNEELGKEIARAVGVGTAGEFWLWMAGA